MLNVVSLVGRLTADPKLTFTQNNLAICKFTIAVDRNFKKEGQPTADFPRVVCFGKTAENVQKYLGKGRLVAVTGRIQTGSYKNDEGRTIFTTDVIADSVQFLDRPKDAEEKTDSSTDGFTPVDDVDDDLPF